MIGGLILAGGRSSRFGREKALADLDGEPMIARVEQVLARGVSHLAVSAASGSAAAAYAARRGLACLTDDPADPMGPLAGLKAGLRWAKSQGLDWLATSPCDTPFLPADLVARLSGAMKAHGAVAITPAGLQPLCAIWPTAALDVVDARPGHPPIRILLAQIGMAQVAFGDLHAFDNLNTPDDYAQAQARRG